MRKRLLLVVLCWWSNCALLGCHSEHPPQQPEAGKPSAEAISATLPKPFIYPYDLELSDLWIRPSANIPVTGDLRPLWRVHGRISNRSHYSATRVKLEVQIWTETEMVDSAVLEIKAEILPGATRSFEQEVHLAPPKGKWEWDCLRIEVDAQNSLPPMPPSNR